MTWCVIDLETTVHSGFKRKANVFMRDELGAYKNWVVMMGWCTKDNQHPQGMRMTQQTQSKMTDKFIELLQSSKMIVGQNIKFDLLYLLRDPRAYTAWQDWVVNGGNVWDCQLAEYLLQGQIRQAHMLSMDDMALYYDLDTKVDEVKLLWDAGVQTEDIDPDLLARYLLGEDLPNGGRREGDIGVTRNVFLKQLARAQKEGMSRLLMLEFGALIASIEMERNGMYVDKALGYKLADELRIELAAAKEELHAYLPADLPFEFNWGNRYHLSPIIFGGRIFQIAHVLAQHSFAIAHQTEAVLELRAHGQY